MHQAMKEMKEEGWEPLAALVATRSTNYRELKTFDI